MSQSQKIECYVDIYKNIYQPENNSDYVYSNIRAKNADEQEALDKYIELMEKKKDSIIKCEIISHPDWLPCETNRLCFCDGNAFIFGK